MWQWHQEHHREWVRMSVLVLLALASIGFSVWGMLGFDRPDFFAAATPKTVATVLTLADCKDCSSPESFLAEFESQGFVVAKKQTVDAASKEGKALIAKYGIEKVPTVVMQKTSTQAQTFLKEFGTVSDDGMFVLRDVVPPYQDVKAQAIKGRFGIILVTDKSCADCYDVALHKTPLARLGMTASDEKIVDVSDPDGKKLVELYKIETVPTLLLQGELSEYASLNQVWNQVGTIESDGTYVFRSGQDSMGTYRVLKTKEIKKVAS